MSDGRQAGEGKAPKSKGRWLLGCFGWVVAANLLVLIAAFVGFDWWAGRELEDAHQAWADAGLAGEFRDLVPAPVPEAENFGAHPLLFGAGEPGAVDGEFVELWDSLSCDGSLSSASFNFMVASSAELPEWLRSLEECGTLPAVPDRPAAEAMLAVTEPVGVVVAAVAPGRDRPSSLMVPGYERNADATARLKQDLDHRWSLVGLGRALMLRTVVLIEAGKAEEATVTLEVGWRVVEMLANNPTGAYFVVGAPLSQMMVDCTWAGMEEEAFDLGQLARLHRAMDRIKLRERLVVALQSDALDLADLFALTARGEIPEGLEDVWPDYRVPAAFWEANGARLLDGMREHHLVPLRDQGWRAALASTENFKNAMARRKERYNFTEFMVRQVMYDPKWHEYGAVADASLTLAMAACAIEQYALEHGSYPESLTALEGAPDDPMAPGTPLGYARTGERYRLWSVGFDGADDGGVIVGREGEDIGKAARQSTYRGDWVWGYPPPVAESLEGNVESGGN